MIDYLMNAFSDPEIRALGTIMGICAAVGYYVIREPKESAYEKTDIKKPTALETRAVKYEKKE